MPDAGVNRRGDTGRQAYGDDMQQPSDKPAPDQDAPVGGDETTEDQLVADNAVEEDQLKALDPNDSPA